MTPGRTPAVGEILWLPSGPRHDRAKPHDHLVVAVDETQVLLAPLSSVKPGFKGLTVVVTKRDLDWLSGELSDFKLSQVKLRPVASLDDVHATAPRRTRATVASVREATPASRALAARLAQVLAAERAAPDFARRFLARVVARP